MSFLRTEYENLLGSRSTPLIRLIVVNIIVFLIANIWVNIPGGEASFYDYFALPSSPIKLLHRPWTLITSMFVHVSFGHIFSNMFWLYFIGRIFEDFVRGYRIFYTYLFGGLAGGLLFLLFSSFTRQPYPMIGASAGVMAVVVAIAVLVPNYSVYLFIIGEVKLKYVVLASFILSSIVDFSVNSGGKVAHIGGALYGIIYMVQYKQGTDFAMIANNFFKKFLHILFILYHIYRKKQSPELGNCFS